MDAPKKKKKGFFISREMLNVILGILALICIVFYFIVPSNKFIFFLGVLDVGLINLINGFAGYRSQKQKNAGMSSILVGGVIIAIGMYAVMAGLI